MTPTTRTSPLLQQPLVLAVLGALLLSGGWAPWPTAWLAPLLLIGWVPYLLLERQLTLTGARKGRVFASTYLMLVLWNALTTWWVSYADLAAGIAAVVLNALLMCLPLMAFRQTKKRLGNRWGYLSLPIYWIAFEQLHLHWDITWPWLTLGNGFAAAPQWVQWYEYTGFLGGSAWVWVVNLLFFNEVLNRLPVTTFYTKSAAGLQETEMPTNIQAAAGSLIKLRTSLAVPLLAIALPIGLSYLIGAAYTEKGPTAEVVVVQPNFDPYVEKFEGGPKFIPYDEQLTRLMQLSEQHLTPATRLVLWPETALEEPYWENTFESNPKIRRVREWLGRHPGVALLTGITTLGSYPSKEAASETARYRDDLGYYDFFNTGAFFADATAPVVFYHKSRLVPGVEKIPPVLASLISHIDLGGTVGSVGSQPERTVYPAPANVPALRLAPVICYESIYGDFIGEYAHNGATLLGLVTNDAWWHDSPGYRQLLSYGQLRCIETRRDLARSANTGFTGFINQKGEITQREKAWIPTASRATVHLNNEVTFYVRFGELIGRGAQALAVLLLVCAIVRGWQRKSSVEL
ncbi:apolipoprotein N-acyltransferase [Microvirga sp. STS02]|uniref:apolipoprotein N-acyltransferase n=1 Tax=Hymenobacter negativus TaxID=2795026 RepID=UPI0018DC43C1|nr:MULTISPECIES: apolipoprotein N-acyltransferase [Bacteria]MBH8570290.1 apolipoprotein N-acyltransferase [Hymenobacter negativus]MBR7210029.1 apolipoprotein N-acyltransferase [Microvirga sp. STS02]